MPLRFLTAGESHGPSLTAILEGVPAGLPLQTEIIDAELARRQRGYGSGPRMKLEQDRVQILGGVMEGVTTGAPLAFSIDNLNHTRWRGKAIEPFTVPRPGHIDLAGALKFGYRDLRPGLERASARETAARVAVGAVCRFLLAQFGIQIGGYVLSIGKVIAEPAGIPYGERFRLAEANDVRCPVPETAPLMEDEIRQAISDRDTLGGIIEIVALGVPPGFGSHTHWDRRLEGRLGAALLSVQAIKGVEFGDAFANAHLRGTQAQDAIRLDGEQITRPSNRAGGLEGGVTNGMPVILRAAMKPIATTLTPQLTVDLATGEETNSHYERSDFCPVPRAVPILEAMTSFVLADALLEKLGGDTLEELKTRFAALRQSRLGDLPMDESPHIFWPEE